MKPLEFSLKEPGKTISIGGIPTAITWDHNEVFYYWLKLGIKNATLLHIDAHLDHGIAKLPGEYIDNLLAEHWPMLTIDAFICPAFHAGVISDIYWLNPQSADARLMEIGSAHPTNGSFRLETKIIQREPNNPQILMWDDETVDRFCQDYNQGRIILPSQIKIKHPFILDVDLDAFCCLMYAENVQEDQDLISDYDKKIFDTGALLRNLGKRPDLITITRSAGGRNYYAFRELRTDLASNNQYRTTPYTPRNLIKPVEEMLMSKLRVIYE